MAIERIQPGEWNSRASIHDNVVYLSGIVADDKTLPMKGQTEQVLAKIDAMPDVEALRAEFDEERAYANFVSEHQARQDECGDIIWCPADWSLIPKALWYHEFGYDAALTTLALHPDRYRKLIQVSAERGHQREGYVSEFEPCGRPVNVGGLIEVHRHVRQPRDVEQHVVRPHRPP